METSTNKSAAKNSSSSNHENKHETSSEAAESGLPSKQDIPKVRFDRLQKLCNKALEESIKTLTVDNLSSCYPVLSSTVEGVSSLKVAREQISNFWFKSSLKEFHLIFKERDVEEKLNQLDEIIFEAQQRKEKFENSKLRNKKSQTKLGGNPSAIFDEISGSRMLKEKANEEDEDRSMNDLFDATESPVFIDELTPTDIITSHLNSTKNRSFERLQLVRDSLRNDNMMLLKELNDLSTDIGILRDEINDGVSILNKISEIVKNDNQANFDKMNQLVDYMSDQ